MDSSVHRKRAVASRNDVVRTLPNFPTSWVPYSFQLICAMTQPSSNPTTPRFHRQVPMLFYSHFDIGGAMYMYSNCLSGRMPEM